MKVEAFEETAETITLHGLGFLQIKLQGKQRLHVWHPDLPRRTCFRHSSIHDHRFSFVSRVLVGRQLNTIYRAKRSGMTDATHMSYLHEGARTAFGNRPWIADETLRLTTINEEVIRAGDSYSMDAYVYHSTEPGGDGRVATLMTKTWEGGGGAHSLCEVGHMPDVDFDRKQWPEERLWEIVRDVLGRHG
jgi:hypothetical protein